MYFGYRIKKEMRILLQNKFSERVMKNKLNKEISQLIFGLFISAILLSGCTKDLFYIPGTVQEEMEKAVDGGFDG